MIDSIDLYREGDQLRSHLYNAARMIDGVRSGGKGYTSAVVTMTTNAAENALEAALESIRRAKTEARRITYQREKGNPVFDGDGIPPARPSASLPAVVSPCAAE